MSTWTRIYRGLSAGIVATGVALASGCGDSGTVGPGSADLEILVLSGDGQVALAETPLPEAFSVRVRDRDTQRPSAGVAVSWSIVSGLGARLTPALSETNASGVATALLTLGPELGEYQVEATFEGLAGAPARFTASALRTPELTSITEGPVSAGGTVVVDGANFLAGTNPSVVLFSGIAGQVTAATANQITARVPACLPSREVEVTVRTGSLTSNAMDLTVAETGVAQAIPVGGTLSLVGAVGSDCVRLSGDGGAEYLAVVSSASQVAAATWSYVLTGLVGSATGEQPVGAVSADARSTARSPRVAAPSARLQVEWDRTVRGLERGLAPRAPNGPAPAPVARRVPALGERREFSVLNAQKSYTPVTAEVVHVSDRAVIYQDLLAPSPGLTQADFTTLGTDFDDPIYATSVGAFGEVGDMDGNERVAVLFTPVVNQLTPRGSDGFVGGFFFGLDLLQGQNNSNEGEVFYAVVPDPGAEFGDARSRQLVMDVIPAILAHEFQHMISFTQRVVVLKGTAQEALWLSEAMAQMAEDVVGDAFLEQGDSAKAVQYKSGNWIRAARYLADPGDVSLIVAQGQGSLEERGGGWLFIRYLRDRSGGNALLGELTRTTRVGVANVTAASGASWEDLLPDFSTALYLDGLGVPAPDRLLFPDFDLRGAITQVEEPYPLVPRAYKGGDVAVLDDLWSSSADFVTIQPPEGASLAVALSGANGGTADSSARLHLTLVRLR